MLALAAVVVVGRSARTSDTPLRDLARPFLCFAVLLVLLARSAPDGSGGAQAGSPAWLAERGVGMSNLVADQISQAAPRPRAAMPDNLLDCQLLRRHAADARSRRTATTATTWWARWRSSPTWRR